MNFNPVKTIVSGVGKLAAHYRHAEEQEMEKELKEEEGRKRWKRQERLKHDHHVMRQKETGVKLLISPHRSACRLPSSEPVAITKNIAEHVEAKIRHEDHVALIHSFLPSTRMPDVKRDDVMMDLLRSDDRIITNRTHVNSANQVVKLSKPLRQIHRISMPRDIHYYLNQAMFQAQAKKLVDLMVRDEEDDIKYLKNYLKRNHNQMRYHVHDVKHIHDTSVFDDVANKNPCNELTVISLHLHVEQI